MNYKKTLNLPQKVSFRKTKLPQIETEILSLWKDLNIFEMCHLNNKGRPKFAIHTPPLYAHGNITINIAFSMILKDIIVKYKLMNDVDVSNIPIWNCHIPNIENEVLQSLRLNKTEKGSSKISAIRNDELQLANFRKKCHELSEKYVEEQKEQLQRLGIFARWSDSILTSDAEYESESIRAIENLYDSGYLRRWAKPKFWCINCQSDIERSEIEYRGYNLLSLYVKFPIMKGFEELGYDVSILTWIGTPWALSENKPIAINPDYEYAAVEIKDGKIIIMAYGVVDEIMKNFNRNNYRIIKKFRGDQLCKVVCFHPIFDTNTKIVFDKNISIDKGTGITYNTSSHIEYNEDNLEIASPNNFNGILNGEYDDQNGNKLFDPVNPISTELEKRNYLLSSDLTEQSYPHCLYCKQPLIVRTNEHWIFDFTANHLKQRVIKAISGMNHSPNTISRISSSINNKLDLGISRRRIWGIPIPIFYCKKCENQFDISEGIRSCRNIIDQEGINRLLSINPNDILSYDAVCSNCGARDFRWEIDVLSKEFTSLMSYKTILWDQKESQTKAEICLKSDSENGKWDYLSILNSMAIENSLLFNSAIIHGPIVFESDDINDTSNIQVNDLIDDFGADIIRLCAISTNPEVRSKFGLSQLQIASKIYYRIKKLLNYILANIEDFDPNDNKVEYEHLREIDKWMLYKLARFNSEMTKAYENYQYNRIYYLLYNFCLLDISRIYINIIRHRLYTFSKWSSGRRSVQTVFYEIITTLAKLIAPVLSFTADEIWEYIPFAKDEYISVYMSKWPKIKEEYLIDGLEQRWSYLFKIRSAIYKALEKNPQEDEHINNSSESAITLYAHSDSVFADLSYFGDILEEIFMVSKVRIIPPDEPLPDDIFQLEGMDDLSIEIRRTSGKKCERCYIFSDTIGTSDLYPTLCHRCVSILEGGAEYV